MKIAFVTYEYPPDTAFGGIATYFFQLAQLLSQRGHHVEVFSASLERESSSREDNILVHRVLLEDRKARIQFADSIFNLFLARHSAISFDVLETAEAGAHARRISENISDLPLVVKLHTPTYLITELGYVPPTIRRRLIWYFGSIRRFKPPTPFPKYDYSEINELERQITLDADEVTTPSVSLGVQVTKKWCLPEHKVYHIPNPYIPSEDLLDIPYDTETQTISFVGRLEVRKGILDMGKAIPMVLKYFPNVKFRFVGNGSAPSPKHGMDMQAYLAKSLGKFQSALEFTGHVELENIPSFLRRTDICVFPSIWENFPNVCLESMAAGRGIVASNAGGMADMLNSGKAGCLIPPRDPVAIAAAVCRLLENPPLRMQLGQAARDRVLSEYSADRIGALQEASYQRAIDRRKRLGARSLISTTNPLSKT